MTSTKAVIYCRISSKKQELEGNGNESQEFRCREYAKFRDLRVIAVFADTITGGVEDRAGLDAMIEMLRAHRDKEQLIVLIDDMSRMARDYIIWKSLKAKITKAGGLIVSLNQQIASDDDPDGEFIEGINALGAELFRKKNRKQTNDRMRARMGAGFWVFPAPIGYVFDGPEKKRYLKPCEPAASVIREAFEGYASGRFQTKSEVARFLAAEPRYPRSKVHDERVTEMFSRPLYAGFIDFPSWGFRMHHGNHEPLISVETFVAVQKKMEQRAPVPARRDINADFPLRNFVECADCVQPYKSCWSRGRSAYHPYYLCQTKSCTSYGKSVRRDVLEGAFERLLDGLEPSPSLMILANAWFADLWNEMRDDLDTDRAILKEEGIRLDDLIQQLVDRILKANSTAAIEAYEKKIEALEIEKATLNEKVSKCGRAIPDFDETLRTALDFISDPKMLWNSDKLEDKRALLKLAFASPLRYERIEGFRTAEFSKPFNFFKGLIPDNTVDVGDGALGRSKLEPKQGLEP